jgi:hypothetical protein
MPAEIYDQRTKTTPATAWKINGRGVGKAEISGMFPYSR